jgi:hypothetical protein
MRNIIALIFAMALTAEPAWAHHKPNHRDARPAVSTVSIERDPCGVSNSPHETPASQAMGRRCQQLRAELAGNPNDQRLRARCDRLARAISGRACSADAR